MTPLSDALARLAAAADLAGLPAVDRPIELATERAAEHFEPPGALVVDPPVVAPSVEDCFSAGWYCLPGGPVEAPPEDPPEPRLIEPAPDEPAPLEAIADETAAPEAEPAPPLKVVMPAAGHLALFCDLTGDDAVVYRVASSMCDLVIHLDMTGAAGALRGRRSAKPAPHSFAGVAPRDWVLFLDACRQSYAKTGLILPANAGSELEWLVTRCDEAYLVAGADDEETAGARRAASRLRRAAFEPPTCLLVEAA